MTMTQGHRRNYTTLTDATWGNLTQAELYPDHAACVPGERIA